VLLAGLAGGRFALSQLFLDAGAVVALSWMRRSSSSRA
jgi:hypothetical protein